MRGLYAGRLGTTRVLLDEPVADAGRVFAEQDAAEFLEPGRRVVERTDDCFAFGDG